MNMIAELMYRIYIYTYGCTHKEKKYIYMTFVTFHDHSGAPVCPCRIETGLKRTGVSNFGIALLD